MITRIGKWGNSLGVRISKFFAREAKIDLGTAVDVTVRNRRIIIRPVAPADYKLEDLLAGITAQNLHGAVDTGDAVGREVW